jgi:hypothetical protein
VLAVASKRKSAAIRPAWQALPNASNRVTFSVLKIQKVPVHHESRISTQANEDEVIWQGFLADEDASRVVSKVNTAPKSRDSVS